MRSVAAILGAALAVGAAPAHAAFTADPASPVAVGGVPSAVAAADFNGDGRTDLAVTDTAADAVHIRLRTAAGTFVAEAGSPVAVGNEPVALVAADLNVDGRPDLAVLSSSTGFLNVWLRNAGGGFTREGGAAIELDPARQPFDVVARDLNGDGRPDLAVANRDHDSATVLLRQALGGFAEEAGSPFAVCDAPAAIAAGELSGDGRADLALPCANGTRDLTTLLRLPAGGFAAEASPPQLPSQPADAATADFDLDGRADVAVALPDGDQVSVLLRRAGGGYVAEAGSPLAVGDGPQRLAVADVDGNGSPDLVVANSHDGTVSVLRNSRSGGAGPGPGGPGAGAPPGGGGPAAPPGGGGAGGAAPPVAAFTVPARIGALTPTVLDARTSANAARYLWDLNGDGRDDIACGADEPLVSVRLGAALGRSPGAGRTAQARTLTSVRLTAVGAAGATSRVAQAVAVPASRSSSPALAVTQPIACSGIAERLVRDLVCRNRTIEFGVVQAKGCFLAVSSRSEVPASERALLDEAIRQFNASPRKRDYVFQACLEANAARLAGASSGSRGCIRRESQITRAQVDPLLAATDLNISRGPVQVNGLRFEPQGNAAIAVFPQIGRVISSNAIVRLGGARLPVSTRVNLDVEGSGPLYSDPFRSGGRIALEPLVPVGSIGDFGGFSQAGQVRIELVDGDVASGDRSEVTLSLRLPGAFSLFGGTPPSATTVVRAYNDRGPVVDDIDLRVPEANLGGLRFTNVRFHYNARGDTDNVPSTCAARWWKATANVFLGPGDDVSGLRLSPPPSQNGIAFCDGGFKSAGGALQFSSATAPQIFPGVSLTEINFATQLDPTLLRGGGKLLVAGLTEVDGALLTAFPSSRAPYTLSTADAGARFAPLAGRTFTTTTVALGGTVSLRIPLFGSLPLGNGYVLYAYPDYVALGGGALLTVPGMTARLGLEGELNVGTRKFSFKGSGRLCILVEGICLGADAWLTSTGIVACGDIAGELHPGVGYKWGDTLPEIWFPDGCKPSGYWVRVAQPAGAGAGARTFTVPRGVRVQRVRLRGAGGAPAVSVRGPDGEVVSTEAGPLAQGRRIAILHHEPNRTTWIGVRDARPGTYTITPLPGSPAISSLETSVPAAVPRIGASVRGRGARRELHYDVAAQRAQRVTFYERGRETFRPIGTVSSGRGVLRFTPDRTGGAARRITALVEVGGFRVAEPTVARFRVTAGRLRAPSRVRVRRRGTTLRVSWSRAAGATRYGVVVRRADGREIVRTVPARRRTLTVRGVPRTRSGRVTVRALDAAGVSSAPRTTSFRATSRVRPRFHPFGELGRARRR